MAYTLQCHSCGNSYKVPQYRVEKSKYCSRECQNSGQYDSIQKNCECCKKEFKVSNSRVKKKFCSSECQHLTKKTVIERRKDSKRIATVRRGTAKSSTLRKFVFSRKNKECELCGYNEYDFCLDVHHLDENPLNNEIDNLAVLCVICHRKLHKGVIDYAVEKRHKQRDCFKEYKQIA
jgi:hypothetical protein